MSTPFDQFWNRLLAWATFYLLFNSFETNAGLFIFVHCSVFFFTFAPTNFLKEVTQYSQKSFLDGPLAPKPSAQK